MTTPANDELRDLIGGHQMAVRRRYLARRVPPSDVEDVVAEVFTVVWRPRRDWPVPEAIHNCPGG